MMLQFVTLQKEGDLRFDLVRARENSGCALTFRAHRSCRSALVSLDLKWSPCEAGHASRLLVAIASTCRTMRIAPFGLALP
jgi:hypothetical protein